MTEDEELKARLRLWQVAPIAPAARDRILAAALARPQASGLVHRLGRKLELSFSDWRYRPGYKLAALGACLVLGAGIGLSLDAPVDVAGVALAGSVGAAS